MTSNSIPLQGSLFGDNQPSSEDGKLEDKSILGTGEDLSDNQLTKDAKERPRRRSQEKIDQIVAKTRTKKSSSSANSDLPSWSHHSFVEINQLTPVLKHYVELKKAHPERILLYRLGDFFECFFEDAIQLSQLLELTLTGKEGGKSIGRVPMAGIPHHAAERYCTELIKQGLSIALCEQLETTPSKDGNLLKRGITRILTPGTVIEEGMLQSRRNNWLGAVIVEEVKEDLSIKWGLANADVSTGEFFVREGKGNDSLHQELLKLDAAEIICAKTNSTNTKQWCPININLTTIPNTPFSLPEATTSLKKFYELETINGLGIHQSDFAVRAAGGLINYLKKTQPETDGCIEGIQLAQVPLEFPQICLPKEFLIVDAQTRRNLEITSTQKDGQFHGSLLWAIDRTLTAMGGRCLRRWIEAPLIKTDLILERQETVSMLVGNRPLRQSLRRLLRAMGDLERLSGRAGAGYAGARDLVAIADGLERIPKLKTELKHLPINSPKWMKYITNVDQDLIEIGKIIRHKLINNAPLSLSEGGLIHDGVDDLLDGLRNQLDDQNKWLRNEEKTERENSGNQNIKLQFHRTFGYFLSVTKAKANNVPNHWIRRQTLSNEERFVTPNLKEREGKIFQLKARSYQREYELFCDLRELIGKKTHKIRQAAKAVAGLDALTGLAELAATNSYTAPEIITQDKTENCREINIEGSRHPVVEQRLADKKFQPNNINIGNGTDLIILSGPNASGKSCYLRQIGLIQLLTQIGSWVPAEKASLSIADQIFTRVGAVDDLAAGQSTFMVEMAETAFILNQASKRSLVLLDEIGRGTSTFDGLSIAWAVSEYLANKIQSRTIFATHYHELNKISDTIDNVANYQVVVKETGENITFLHKVKPGGASKSYGIEAARLAGVPKFVIKRAKNILLNLEENKIPLTK